MASSDTLLGSRCATLQAATEDPGADLAGVSIWSVKHGAALEPTLPDLPLTKQDFAEFAHVRYAPAQRRSLRTRACLRNALSACAGYSTAPRDWTFARNADGKPFLREAAGLQFSCSHSALMSVVAVAIDRPIGVDIAVVTPGLDLSLIDAFLSRNERRTLSELPEQSRSKAIARIWAMKEATVKMLGIGFSCDISCLDFSLEQNVLASIPGEIANLSEFSVFVSAISDRYRNYSVAIASGR